MMNGGESMRRRWLSAGLCLMLVGCSTMQAYDGERRNQDELARISGDWRVRAGAPVSVILRQVNDFEVGVRYSAIDVLPGKHRLLADCQVAASKRISRHELNIEVYAGERYRLAAETGPGNRECAAVKLESD